MSCQKVVGNFGRLWGRGHEVLSSRRILSIAGKGATPFLQNLVTADLTSPPTPPRPEKPGPRPGVPERSGDHPQQQQQQPDTAPPMVEFSNQLRAACFLDNKGRVVTDSLVWKISNEHYYVDVPGHTADALLQHLQQYKLRRTAVQITDTSADAASAVIYGTLNTSGAPKGYLSALDPRHPSLGLRILKLPTVNDETTAAAAAAATTTNGSNAASSSPSLPEFSKLLSQTFPHMPGNYDLVRRLAGVAEGTELTGRIALETNQEHLNAVSFQKGCYLGQELTARVHYTGVVRKRILPLLLLDPYTQVPSAWSLASSLQQGRALRRFTAAELQSLPCRLPRLSVLTAGNLVAITTGSVQPDQEALDQAAAEELVKVQTKAAELLDALEQECVAGAKLVSVQDGKTVGQIVAPPVKGTNVVLALMRLESVGLLSGGVWSTTNKIKLGDDSDREFRYLPYLPLWWPDLDPETGKAKADDDKSVSSLEARGEEELETENAAEIRSPRIETEQIPLDDDSQGAGASPSNLQT